MLCKIARTCIGFVSRVERSTRPERIKIKRCMNKSFPASGYPRRLEEDKRDHLIRTEGSYRQDEEMDCTVIDIEMLSNAVRGIKLVTREDKATSFKAGQWVDMIIPNVKTVGGFSICSPPQLYNDSGQLLLAIKYSDHPPAKWIHEQCHVGSKVKVKFGGDFYYVPELQKSQNVLLIAGGVGINPIYSILQERCESPGVSVSTNTSRNTKLLYSAKSEEDLIFQKEIADLCSKTGSSYQFFLTGTSQPDVINGRKYSYGRINLMNLKDSIDCFNGEQPICFICGPPNFIDSMVESLMALGLEADNIKYEKWW